MNRKVLLQISLIVVGVAQIFFGVAFTFAPEKFSGLLGLSTAPQWAYWMFSMFGARSFAFAYGMLLAARDPMKHIHWIKAMIAVVCLCRGVNLTGQASAHFFTGRVG